LYPKVVHPSYYPLFDSIDLISIKDSISRVAYYPESKNIFRALNHSIYDVRVVFLFLSPYQNNYANGLATSSTIMTPTLSVIEQSLQEYLDDYSFNIKTDLLHWEKQGILLLNTALTVPKQGSPTAHVKLWKPFTTSLIKYLEDTIKPLFVFFGNDAKEFYPLVSNGLCTIHPVAKKYNPDLEINTSIWKAVDNYCIYKNNEKIIW
jgi:uracil-DNA glycosylase